MTQIFSAIAKTRQEDISVKQQQVRKFFQKQNSPFYYISYADFCNNFEVHAGKNFTNENLNIIDTHLKYRQSIYEEMAPYKWIPVISYSLFKLIRFRGLPLIFPFVYTTIFDHYLHPFFVWLHKDDKIINIRYEFATKLSKVKNKQRRVKLFKNLQKSLKREDQIIELQATTQPNNDKIQTNTINSILKPPHKYIKFGFPTQYVFHALTDEVEMSTILQTKFFQTYLNLRYPSMNTVKQLFTNLTSLTTKFLQYKKDKQPNKYFLDLKQLMKFKDIKQTEQYQLSTCIQKRVRRWLQVFMFERKNLIYYSNFTLDNILFLYEHKHLNQEPKYNIEQNAADLTIYYTFALIPALLLKFLKR